MADKPLLSIIITSYTIERLKDIFELLDSLPAQTYHNFETILVIEKSIELYSSLRTYIENKHYLNTTVLFNNLTSGISVSRNMGIKEANGDIIAFIDDDALPFPEWAENMVKSYDAISVIGITGPATPLWEGGETPNWFPEEFYWIFGCSAWRNLNERKAVRNVLGANMSFKREAFEQGGLFPEWLGGKRTSESQKTSAEETELSVRITNKTGKQIIFNPDVKIWHKVDKQRLKLSFIRRRAYIEGYSKGILKRNFVNYNDSKVLDTEYALMRRILFHLLPHMFKDLFNHPTTFWRKLQVISDVLYSVSLGYVWGTIHPPKDLKNLPKGS